MQLTIEERKQKLVAYAENFPIEDMPGITDIMSEDSKFIRISREGVKICGYKSEDEMYLTGYEDLKCQGSRCKEMWERDEKYARETRNVVRVISYANFDSGPTILFGHQRPIVDEESNEVIGIVGNFMDMTKNTMLDIGRLILMENGALKRKQFQYRLQDNAQFEGLCKREQEVLFWYLRNVNSTGISRRLSTDSHPLTPQTVRSYVRNAKLKLGVSTKEQLLEKCISIGFMATVPESLFID